MLLTNLTAATMTAGYGLIPDAAVGISGSAITWVGERSDAPAETEIVDCGGRLLTPGLIDCHTHLVYGGSRANEFELRLSGVPYADIAAAGGGIAATVRATRAATEDELLASARVRLECLTAEGATTVEIKSGYGLDIESEIKMLRTAKRLGTALPVDVVTSFLGAHALPPEYHGNRAAYIDLVCGEMLSAVAAEGLADAVDGFCEGIAFTVNEIAQVFDAARRHGLPVKLHAEQLSNLGGAQLAARHGALSVDHLEYLDAEGVEAIAASGTVATLLPGAFYYLREKQLPPVQMLRSRNVPIAVATDLNPGSSPVHSLLSAMNMACVLFSLSPEEALLGTTVHAAKALGLSDRGVIAAGKRADLVLWDVERPGELSYPLGLNPARAILRGGHVVRGHLT